VTGEGAEVLFRGEAGGHRWQRSPKNDRHGRIHSSTITIAALEEPTEAQFHLRPQDLDIKCTRAGGKGGQNVNKVESAVQITHLPTGLQVRCETERSQHQNRANALALMRARLASAEREKNSANRAADRKRQVGSGERSDKIRTVAFQRDEAVDHRSGRRWRLKDYLNGDWG